MRLAGALDRCQVHERVYYTKGQKGDSDVRGEVPAMMIFDMLLYKQPKTMAQSHMPVVLYAYLV